MTAEEALRLIQLPHPPPPDPQTWADLGAGTGLFTHALLQQLPPGSQVYAVDRDNTPTPAPGIIPQKIDFVRSALYFPPLNGVLMANSLHFVQDQRTFLHQMAKQIVRGGMFLLVEYDTDTPNPWVPFPLRFSTLQERFRELGLNAPQRIHTMPSKFGGAQLYSAWCRMD